MSFGAAEPAERTQLEEKLAAATQDVEALNTQHSKKKAEIEKAEQTLEQRKALQEAARTLLGAADAFNRAKEADLAAHHRNVASGIMPNDSNDSSQELQLAEANWEQVVTVDPAVKQEWEEALGASSRARLNPAPFARQWASERAEEAQKAVQEQQALITQLGLSLKGIVTQRQRTEGEKTDLSIRLASCNRVSTQSKLGSSTLNTPAVNTPAAFAEQRPEKNLQSQHPQEYDSRRTSDQTEDYDIPASDDKKRKTDTVEDDALPENTPNVDELKQTFKDTLLALAIDIVQKPRELNLYVFSFRGKLPKDEKQDKDWQEINGNDQDKKSSPFDILKSQLTAIEPTSLEQTFTQTSCHMLLTISVLLPLIDGVDNHFNNADIARNSDESIKSLREASDKATARYGSSLFHPKRRAMYRGIQEQLGKVEEALSNFRSACDIKSSH